MIRGLACGVSLLVSGAIHAAAQDSIQFRDPGPGGGPPALVQALAGPHTVVPPATTRATLSRQTTYSRSVIVLGRDAVVEDTVRGDVIVVGGDLYMHPGADISGQAVAIGGGVYESTLARVAGGTQSHRDFTYDIARIPSGWVLSYRALETAEESFTVEGTYGLRVPTYDRADGLSLAVAPAFAIPRTAVRIEPGMTYRSQLGRLDPSILFVDSLDRRTALRVAVGRSTLSNDAWMWTDLVNSLLVLWRGDDSRNYFRATRGDVTVSRRWKTSAATVEPYVGGRGEEASSVRPGQAATSGPWSFFGRRDVDDMRRPNPAIDAGRTASFLTGVEVKWAGEIAARLRLDEELGAFRQTCADCTVRGQRHFAQTTLDGTIGFPTFGTQRLRVDGHAVITAHGDSAPAQRWAYVGGSASIPTLAMLSRGGDQLAYLDAHYDIPIDQAVLPVVGSPILTLREIVGGAALGRFPTLAQATGVRLSVSYVYVEWLVDPVTRRQHHSYGIAIAR